MPYTVNKLREDFYAIDEGMVRSFLLMGNGRALLIDTGACGENLRALCQTLTDAEITVLLTHADGDHTAACAQFSRVRLHPLDSERFACAGFDKSALLPLAEGDVYTAGQYALEVLHIPGHTKGSCAFLCREHRFLLSGDSASRAPIFMFGEGRSLPEYAKSAERLAALAPDIDTVYPAHGDNALPAQVLLRLPECARLCLAGDITPRTPAMPIPAKLYAHKDVALLL